MKNDSGVADLSEPTPTAQGAVSTAAVVSASSLIGAGYTQSQPEAGENYALPIDRLPEYNRCHGRVPQISTPN